MREFKQSVTGETAAQQPTLSTMQEPAPVQAPPPAPVVQAPAAQPQPAEPQPHA
jgi:hypothetical protein